MWPLAQNFRFSSVLLVAVHGPQDHLVTGAMEIAIDKIKTVGTCPKKLGADPLMASIHFLFPSNLGL